ncbi:methyltransferase [Achromatium sp. WMS2]|nr:methyltransferase [Achromatium sp. WMS2]
MQRQYHIQFPQENTEHLKQNEAFFFLRTDDGEVRKIFFHDYQAIYNIPGLYEQLYYERLHCRSPEVVTELLHTVVQESREHFTELRVMDVGAGNGMMGEMLHRQGISRLIGIDILPEAFNALERDRPGLYDAYYIVDCCNLTQEEVHTLTSWACNCMTVVSAVGFDDIPPKAFIEAFNLLTSQGWIAFNIKETFLNEKDNSGFSTIVRKLLFSEYLEVHHFMRYRHRLSIEGQPLYYFAVVARKQSDVPLTFFTA